MRGRLSLLIGAAALAAVGACAPGGKGLSTPPRPKPKQVNVKVVNRAPAGPRLSRASVSTKSGDILILEPDGSVSAVALDSPSGRDAFQVTEQELNALSVNLGLKLSPADVANFDIVAPRKPRIPTEQQKALEAFAARTRPALPDFPANFKAEPQSFGGALVRPLSGDKSGELVEVSAKLKPGVDADLAFAYATCALAGWAKAQGRHYGRHIRTLQNKGGGTLQVGSVFTLSDKKPMGLRVMETNQTLQSCKDRGIPAA